MKGTRESNTMKKKTKVIGGGDVKKKERWQKKGFWWNKGCPQDPPKREGRKKSRWSGTGVANFKKTGRKKLKEGDL